MANYTKSTNFAIKDSLISGDPAKIVKGTEIDTELVNIQSAVNSKRDSASSVSLSTEVSGTLPVANGGTGATTLTGVLRGTGTSAVTAGNVNLSTEVSNTLPVANGGTGQTTASSAINALIPSQTGNNGKFLSTNGTAVSWEDGATGDVVGPSSASDDHIVSYDGVTGKLIGQANTVNLGTIKFGRGGGNIDNNICIADSISFGNASNTGAYNIGIGTSVFIGLLTGTNNVAIGNGASSLITSGTYNVAIGYYAGGIVTGGDYNVCIGEDAGSLISNGNNNTALGTQSLQSFNKSNCSALGYQADVTGNDQVQLGNSSTTTYVYGTVQNRSDERDKADIRDTQLGLGFIKALRPVDYKWDMREDYKQTKPSRESYETAEAYTTAITQWQEANSLSNLNHDGTHKRNRYHHGLIAQEVKQVIEAHGIDFGGFQDHTINGGDDVLSIGYDELVAPMIKAIQELTIRLEGVEAELAALKAN